MSIWTCKKVVTSLVFGLFLSACDEGGEGFAFLPKADQAKKSDQVTEARRNVALSRAEMMRGKISLVPADGFCIDKRVLKQNLAVLARCDSLGGKGGALDAPLGMILVSVAEVDTADQPGAVLDALTAPDAEVVSRKETEGLALAQLRGTTPEGTDPQHWRAVSQIGTHVVSVVGYAPEGGAFAGQDGGRAVASLMERTKNDTIANSVGRMAAKEGTSGKKGLGGLLKGLFD